MYGRFCNNSYQLRILIIIIYLLQIGSLIVLYVNTIDATLQNELILKFFVLKYNYMY